MLSHRVLAINVPLTFTTTISATIGLPLEAEAQRKAVCDTNVTAQHQSISTPFDSSLQVSPERQIHPVVRHRIWLGQDSERANSPHLKLHRRDQQRQLLDNVSSRRPPVIRTDLLNQTGGSLPAAEIARKTSVTIAPSTCFAALAFCVAFHCALRLFRPVSPTPVPWANSSIPLIGNVLEYGADPVKFLLKQKELLGDVFRVNLVIMSITFCIGPQVSSDRHAWERVPSHEPPCSGTDGCTMRLRKKNLVCTRRCPWRLAVSLTNNSSIRDG